MLKNEVALDRASDWSPSGLSWYRTISVRSPPAFALRFWEKCRIRKIKRTSATMPPAMPPTMGPHFSAGEVSESLLALDEVGDGEGEPFLVLFVVVVAGAERVEDELVRVGTLGNERESVVVPVGVAVE